MGAPSDDEVVRELRRRITELDAAIFDALNDRIELVARLKEHKDRHGYDFVDPGRETAMVDDQVARNRGPLSAAGLRRFYAELLALVKREVG